jgi:hypothetical protein
MKKTDSCLLKVASLVLLYQQHPITVIHDSDFVGVQKMALKTSHTCASLFFAVFDKFICIKK